jgi:uncharacterized membrane protein YpjA
MADAWRGAHQKPLPSPAAETNLDGGPGGRPRVDLVAFFGRFKTARAWAAIIAAINLVGIVYGFYYYREQFAVTPVWLWPFVPDSPLAVLWAELALIAYWIGWRPGALDALAFVGNVQVGLWTVYVLLAYASDFGTYAMNLNTILLAGHAGMAVLGTIFLDGLRKEHGVAPRRAWIAIGVAAAYYLVNDALDYLGRYVGLDFVGRGCGLRPFTVPCRLGAPESWLAAVTFGLTLLGVVTMALVVRARSRET